MLVNVKKYITVYTVVTQNLAVKIINGYIDRRLSVNSVIKDNK